MRYSKARQKKKPRSRSGVAQSSHRDGRPSKPTGGMRAKSRPKTNVKDARRGRRTAGALFERLVALQAQLRAPNGCPWDREQTPQSLRPFLVEETYEVLDALENGDAWELAGELGDLLLQVIFHSLMAREAGQFDIRDVIENVHDKMVRRHPHVFGATTARTSADVLRNWEQLKAEERKSRAKGASAKGSESGSEMTSLLDGIPRSLPAVLEAAKLTRRAAHIGFDWENAVGVLDKVREECAELQSELRDSGNAASGLSAAVEEEAGDLLFAAVNVARVLGLDPEIALKKANRKFSQRFRWMEAEALHRGGKLAETTREEMEKLWDLSKTSMKDAARPAEEMVEGERKQRRHERVPGKQ
jgi:MazG family protein